MPHSTMRTPKEIQSIRRLAVSVQAARINRHKSVALMASEIGISASALRRIENGTSSTIRIETILAIFEWARSRGIREFGGVRIDDGSGPDQQTSDL
jgi:transcriptional regulator with XRE-family HTH domain